MGNKIKMLWTGDFIYEWYEKFQEYCDIETTYTQELKPRVSIKQPDHLLSEDELAERLQGKEIWLAGYDICTAGVIARCPDLKLIISVRDGPEENIDIAACTKAGIPVFNCNGRNAIAVAEFVIIQMLMLSRPIITIRNMMSDIGYTNATHDAFRGGNLGAGHELHAKTLGLIGLGRNGRNIARICGPGFQMKVVCYDPYVSEETMTALGVEKTELNDLLERADYVVIMVRPNDDNYKMLKADAFARMKPTAYFINTARGWLVDTGAMIEAVQTGKIAGIACDVYDPEPDFHDKDPAHADYGIDPRLYEIPADKCFITPHVAGSCIEQRDHTLENDLTALTSFLHGVKPFGCMDSAIYNEPAFSERGGKLFGCLT